MRRGVLATALAAAVALGLVACAPAVPGVPGTPPASVAPETAAHGGPEGVPSVPERARAGAFALGSGAIVIDTWVDFFCPYCRAFEESNGELIRTLVEQGRATLRVHPIAFLDRASMGTRYSTRAANAFACVAEYAPAGAFDYMAYLYANQPPESTPGLDDDALAGAAPGEAVDCIREGWFADWVGEATRGALEAGVRGTPTVLVNGMLYRGRITGGDFRDAVLGSTV